MAREEAGRSHRLPEELEDRIPALERVLAPAVRDHGVGREAFSHLVPELLVETSHVAVLEALDERDLDEVGGGHSSCIRERRPGRPVLGARERAAPGRCRPPPTAPGTSLSE